ncbi:M48 family metallopeptidase [Nitrincola iocasae]|uniref:M48 family metallopeptidase n=1 Tax=Nitrincola iocasae TaxID=2614693 RepID=A0A5J6LID6_9GAMM|nr:M48 family metallopeptidase [Nitrincola iocasae]QEW08325.1 M48 family metallopeptidase [Nitrincola iocasae]
MNFFEHQDRARRKTLQLVLLFILGVISLILTLTLAVGMFLYFQQGSAGSTGQGQLPSVSQVFSTEQLPLLGGIALAVCAVVLLGSLFRRMQLGSGGHTVAEALGGRLLNTATRDANEKRILNVVEEMALASGIAVPPVYLLDDDGINAFAAGFNPQDAVIGITRGAIELLSRDELQGVIAHEFSHILHGDMRLNIRLISWLYGILLLGLIGRFLLSSLRFRRVRSSRNDKSAAVMMLLGVGLLIVGYAGSFFGNLIKAAVSRQREFLADASAVQYTRNPQGIAGALKKIGGHYAGSSLNAPGANEFSHMYFGSSGSSGLTSLLATHPPLEERIKRVDPGWNGELPQPERPTQAEIAQEESQQPTGSGDMQASALAAMAMTASSVNAHQAAQHSMAAMGDPDAAHLAYARNLLQALDEQLLAAAHEPFSARALIYGLLLSDDAQIREQQLIELEQQAHPDTYAMLKQHLNALISLDARLRLPLTDLALPALKQLTAEQYKTFKSCMDLLIRADNKISLFEWSLRKIVIGHLEGRRQSAKRFKLKNCHPEMQRLITLFAHAGHSDQATAAKAYQETAAQLQIHEDFSQSERPSLKQLELDLNKLAHLRPLQKPSLLQALVTCASHDGRISVTEAELLRAIADCLDCPLPPLLAEKDPYGA